MLQYICLSILLAYVEARDPKWFLPRRTVTNTIPHKQLATIVVPSSCVVYEATNPCRNVRKMDIEPNKAERIEATVVPDVNGLRSYDLESGESEQIASPRWNTDWVWPYVTVNETVFREETVKQYDMNTVVSIIVKGCRPKTMHTKLRPCKNETGAEHQLKREIHYTPE